MSFAALGWSLASGKPAVCVTTSGSAVANLLPACVEASHSGVPLIFLTADRPPELRGTGANQTIHQPGLFGTFVRFKADIPCAGPADSLDVLQGIIQNAWRSAVGENPGPVHLNMPFREPLLPAVEGADVVLQSIATVENPPRTEANFNQETFFHGQRGVVVIGRLPASEQSEAQAAIEFADRLGWPVFADALSGARLASGVIRHADAILLRKDIPSPDRVLHFGGSQVSKRIGQWISHCKGRDYLQVRRSPQILDPWDQKPVVIQSGIADFCRSHTPQSQNVSSWKNQWVLADTAVSNLIEARLDNANELTEPGILRVVARFVSTNRSALFLGNSMPVRDFDSFAPALASSWMPVFGNRGASGIDGNVATIAGISLAENAHLIGVLGDLTVLHDLNSLALLRGRPVTLVVVNNDGGGIFQFLPLAMKSEGREKLLETPHGCEFKHAAAQFGLHYQAIGSLAELEKSLAVRSFKPRILECKTNRDANFTLHTQLAEQIRNIEGIWDK
jgi:2-succinyl-5-enolpyruvyl-6-hydroxy-3-cyclohexene-1-carboxylate synthase